MTEKTTPYMPFSLAGKRGLILGVANEHSIAFGCAKEAHALGAELVLSCLNDKALPFVAPSAAVLGALLIPCDVEQEGALERLVNDAVAHLGGLDFVIHSIAWAPLDDLHGLVMDSSSVGFSRAMNISCHSFAQLAKLCAPHMRTGGSMITMSYHGATEAVLHYGLMGPVKAALESLVRYLATELGPRNIRVHALSPGPMPTRAASGLENFEGLMQRAREKSPLKRLVTLQEVGQLAAFLAGDAGSGMTGQTIYIDAGYHVVG